MKVHDVNLALERAICSSRSPHSMCHHDNETPDQRESVSQKYFQNGLFQNQTVQMHSNG